MRGSQKLKVGPLFLSVGGSGLTSNSVPWTMGPGGVHPKQHLDLFRHFCTVKPRVTDRLTPQTLVTIVNISCIRRSIKCAKRDGSVVATAHVRESKLFPLCANTSLAHAHSCCRHSSLARCAPSALLRSRTVSGLTPAAIGALIGCLKRYIGLR